MQKRQRLLPLIFIVAFLANAGSAQEPLKPSKQHQTAATMIPDKPVFGGGTIGSLSKWLSVDNANIYLLGDANIFEDPFGKVGIGTTSPTSQLTVQGMIETTLGGYKFPDGTLQTNALD